MDVTIDNFNELYPRILELLNRCLYVSFDEEMTGIFMSDNSLRNKKDDTPDSRYIKMIPVASRFNIIQFGLCFFCEEIIESENENENNEIIKKIVAYPYNFYLFPTTGRDVILSASAIEFLKKNNMDFHKWITKGITCVDNQDDTYYYKKYIEPSIVNDSTTETSTEPVKKRDPIILTKDSDIEFIENNLQKLNIFINNENKTQEYYIFDSCNSFLRRVFYEKIELLYPNIQLKYQNNQLLGYLLSESLEDRELQKQQQINENKLLYNNSIGFRKLFKDLILMKKPIIGHNCFYDLLFMFKTLERQLPNNLNEFKVNINELFPYIYDTKFVETAILLKYNKLSDTSLNQVYSYYQTRTNKQTTIQTNGESMDQIVVETIIESIVETNKQTEKQMIIEVANEFGNYSELEHFHNAGYDAYCTGYVFTCQLIQILQNYNNNNSNNNITISQLLYNNMKELANNKLFMMQSLYHMDIDANNSSNILKANGILLLINNLALNINNTDLITIFENNSINKNLIEFYWIDGTSLIVNVMDDPNAPNNNEINRKNFNEFMKTFIFPKEWIIEDFKTYLNKKLQQTTVNESQIVVNTNSTVTTVANVNTNNNNVWNWFSLFINNIFQTNVNGIVKQNENGKRLRSESKDEPNKNVKTMKLNE